MWCNVARGVMLDVVKMVLDVEAWYEVRGMSGA